MQRTRPAWLAGALSAFFCGLFGGCEKPSTISTLKAESGGVTFQVSDTRFFEDKTSLGTFIGPEVQCTITNKGTQPRELTLSETWRYPGDDPREVQGEKLNLVAGETRVLRMRGPVPVPCPQEGCALHLKCSLDGGQPVIVFGNVEVAASL